MKRLALSLTALFALLMPAPHAFADMGHGQAEKLGTVHFPISIDPQTQTKFDRAVALLHSFEFAQAIAGFQATLETTVTSTIQALPSLAASISRTPPRATTTWSPPPLPEGRSTRSWVPERGLSR